MAIEKECPGCGEKYETRWARQVCCSRRCKMLLRNRDRPNDNWKGGVNKHAAGYLKELSKGHPDADKNGYVMQHRLVMERHLGRHLRPQERVHHKNGQRDDNRIENLELWYLPSQAKKDPAGQRLQDLIEWALRNCPKEAKAVVRADMLAAFGLTN